MSSKKDALSLRKRKTFELRLTKFELLHLRDLFNVKLPPELKLTVSQGLAVVESRPMVETHLWNKLAKACSDAEVPLDDAAPDFICAASSSPSVSVFKLASEPDECQPSDQQGTVFDKVEEDDGDE